MADPRDYVLWGSAGHAKVLQRLIAGQGGRVVALFDNNPSCAPALAGVPLFIGNDGFLEWRAAYAREHAVYGLAAIGGARGADRVTIAGLFREHGVVVDTLVHGDASVCDSARLGAGTQVLARAVVAADAVLGEGCIVNHAASVDHECRVGDGVHVAPGATLCGCVELERHAMIGAGAVVLPRIRIGADAIVGAGAVVIHDVPPGVVVAGNPARIIRQP